jgi:hypothetical protein
MMLGVMDLFLHALLDPAFRIVLVTTIPPRLPYGVDDGEVDRDAGWIVVPDIANEFQEFLLASSAPFNPLGCQRRSPATPLLSSPRAPDPRRTSRSRRASACAPD